MILGITGGIGTGKSTVLNILKDKYGFTIYEADRIAKEIMEKGGLAYNKIIECFGKDILDEKSEIDKEKMSERVFNNKDNLDKLNNIVHPAVIEEIKSRINRDREKGREKFVIEAALLLESKCNEICDKVWYIYSDEETRIERLKCGRGLEEKQIERVMKNQLSETDFRERTDAVIDNSKSIDNTVMQIEKLLEF